MLYKIESFKGPSRHPSLSLDHLRPLLSPACFVVDGYIGLGVPIGTDAFIQHFVKDKCQAIMDDVDKLDNIQDGFIHYQLLRFCQATRLQYLNGQIDQANQNCLQQQHVDWKISNALLKKGTREAYKTWTQQDRAPIRIHTNIIYEPPPALLPRPRTRRGQTIQSPVGRP